MKKAANVAIALTHAAGAPREKTKRPALHLRVGQGCPVEDCQQGLLNSAVELLLEFILHGLGVLNIALRRQICRL